MITNNDNDDEGGGGEGEGEEIEERNYFGIKRGKGFWNEKEHQREYFNRLYYNLKLSSFEEWLVVKRSHLTSYRYRSILTYYHNSFSRALRSVYPNYPWPSPSSPSSPSLPSQLLLLSDHDNSCSGNNNNNSNNDDHVDNNNCDDDDNNNGDQQNGNDPPPPPPPPPPPHNHQKYGGRGGKREGEQEKERSITDRYRRYWSDQRFHRQILEYVFHQLSFQCMDDWYYVDTCYLLKVGAKRIINEYYHGDAAEYIISIFQNYPWEIYRFRHSTKYWQSQKNQRLFLEFLFCYLHFQNDSDWRFLRLQHFKKFRAIKLLKLYSFSLSSLLISHYPSLSSLFTSTLSPSSPSNPNSQNNHQSTQTTSLINDDQNWIFKWKRNVNGFWKNKENHLHFMNHLFHHLHFTHLSDWNRINTSTLIKHGALPLLEYYHWNLLLLFSSLYPNPQTHPLNQQITSSSSSSSSLPPTSSSSSILPFWRFKTKRTEKEVIHHFIINYQIRRKEDWYRIASSHHYNLRGLLKKYYRNEKWPRAPFTSKLKKSKQFQLLLSIHSLLPTHHSFENYHFPSLLSPSFKDNISTITSGSGGNINDDDDSGSGGGDMNNRYSSSSCTALLMYINEVNYQLKERVELDIFIPALNIAFEYQGEHHFDDLINFGFGHLELHQYRDKMKSYSCSQNNIKLLNIPYWSDLSSTSIYHYIKSAIG